MYWVLNALLRVAATHRCPGFSQRHLHRAVSWPQKLSLHGLTLTLIPGHLTNGLVLCSCII